MSVLATLAARTLAAVAVVLASPAIAQSTVVYQPARAAIVKAVCFGHCTPATTFLPMTTPMFNKGSKGYVYDLNKAKQLLKESGVATPLTLKVLYRANDAVHQPTAVALKEMWGKLGVTLEHSLPQGMPQVRADRVQLSQVLLNLVRNAMEAVSAQRSSERKVRIEARVNASQVEVAVIDSGTGIPEDLLPNVFDAFVTTKQAGLGIGLALSRAIVEAHGGDLRAQNNAGRGATFRFTLQAS